MVRYLILIRRRGAEQRGVDRMSDPAAPWPGGEDVVKAPVRIEADSRKRIAVGPCVAGRAVPGEFPAVIEDSARTGHCRASGKHSDLVGIRTCIEVTADDDRIARGTDLLNEVNQLFHLSLANRACV